MSLCLQGTISPPALAHARASTGINKPDKGWYNSMQKAAASSTHLQTAWHGVDLRALNGMA